jgi:hypothetical protein
MSVALCKTLATTMSDSELAQGWRILYEEHQKRAEGIAARNKISLRRGDRVEWMHQSGLMTGTVDRVKRKKALVWQDLNGRPDKSQRWDIPLGMLTKVS